MTYVHSLTTMVHHVPRLFGNQPNSSAKMFYLKIKSVLSHRDLITCFLLGHAWMMIQGLYKAKKTDLHLYVLQQTVLWISWKISLIP